MIPSNAACPFSRCQTACLSLPAPPACARVGRSFRAVSAPSPRLRGGWSADRRTLSFGRACDARPPCPGATGTSLGAPPWRFSDADPRSRLPAVGPEPHRLPAPGRNGLTVGVRTSRDAVRAAARDATPRSAFRFVSGDAPHERGCASYISTSFCSQVINAWCSQKIGAGSHFRPSAARCLSAVIPGPERSEGAPNL